MSEASPGSASRAARLGELARVFLALGVTGFGGPAAHIALMESQVVRRRGWLTREEFLDLLAATNLIPGPNSTEMAMHVGRRRAGFAGLVVAGASFILPAAAIVSVLAAVTARFEGSPALAAMMRAVQPVVIAILAQALWTLGRSGVRSPRLGGIALAALLAHRFGADELTVLAGAAAASLLSRHPARRAVTLLPAAVPLPWSAALAPAAAAAGAAAPFGLATMFLVFLKIGALLFGSGYVLIAWLERDLVHRLGWLTPAGLVEAVAVGQVTPGPVLTTATFIGWRLAEAPGAALATLAIFLPAFVLVAASGPLVPRLRRAPAAAALLDGLVAASLALMASAGWNLGRVAIVDGLTLGIGIAAAALRIGMRVSPVWLVAGAAAAGLGAGALAR